MIPRVNATLRVRCFGGPLHGQLAPLTTYPIFKAAAEHKVEGSMHYGHSENQVTVPQLEWGEYSRQVFGQTHWKTVNDPMYDKTLTLWQRFLVWSGLHRKLTEDEKPKLHFIGRRRGYLYVWNWDGRPFQVNSRVEDLIAWDEIVWERALPHEAPHGWESTEMDGGNGKS